MTRFARAGRKQFEDATPWNQQQVAQSGAGHGEAPQGAVKEKKRKREDEGSRATDGPSSQVDRSPKKAKTEKSAGQEKDEKGAPSPQKSELKEKVAAPAKGVAAQPGKPAKGGQRTRNSHLSAEQRDKLRAARRERRKKAKPCFNCRKMGHSVQDCPEARGDSGVGLCYKCGSTEHITRNCHIRGNEFPYAKCFVCNQTGHLSRACPDNPRGLYPNGGCCKTCGSVEHFARDCPDNPNNQRSKREVQVGRVTDHHADAADEDDATIAMREQERKKKAAMAAAKKSKVVKF